MTPCVYTVRCNFLGPPERERLWHQWYDGPKLRQMLALPQFLSMQRFRAVGLDTRRKYLALWLVESPAAFDTPEYRAQWGFAEWTGEIGDWSRDLYSAPAGIEDVVEIGAGDRLYAAAGDGLTEAAARAAVNRARERRADLAWLEAVGLDRHAPALGLKRIAPSAHPIPLEEPGFVETLFEPLTERARSKGA